MLDAYWCEFVAAVFCLGFYAVGVTTGWILHERRAIIEAERREEEDDLWEW